MATLPLLVSAKPEDGPKSLKARTAVKKYDRAVERAGAAYHKAVADATKDLLGEMEAAKKQAMQGQDLAEATAIQRLADQRRDERPAPDEGKRTAAAPASAIIGVWDVRYANGVDRQYEISATGRVAFSESRSGAMLRRADGPGFLLDFKDGKAERLHLVRDGLLIVEHYNPGSKLASGDFEQIGVGRRRE